MKTAHCILLFILFLLCCNTALAAKARSISSDADSTYHADHLKRHIGDTSCYATGNYIKTRGKANDSKVIGHLEQADEFILLDVQNNWAKIEVTVSDQTSPDSWEGMAGWVNSDYVDCMCSSDDYFHNTHSDQHTSSSIFSDYIGTSSIICTGNNFRIRNRPNGESIIGHLEKADKFILLDIQDRWAQIIVTYVASTSPDSHEGLIGWVSTDYLKIDHNASSFPVLRKGYSLVLDFFYQAISQKIDTQEIANHGFETYEFPDNTDDSGFLYWDINSDGIEELFILRGKDAEIGPILAGYTLINGYPVRIFTSWSRSRNYLCFDGTIYNSGSNGAAYSINYLQHLIDGQLVVYEGVMSDDFEKAGKIENGWFLVDEQSIHTPSKRQLISDKEAENRIAYYESIRITEFDNFIPFSQY